MEYGVDQIVKVSTEEKLKALGDLEPRLKHELNEAAKIIAGCRGLIEENLNSPNNLNGCLRGELDEYLKSFERRIQKVEAKLTEERNYLQDLVESKDRAVNEVIAKLEICFTGI